jgi:hypothetical protein
MQMTTRKVVDEDGNTWECKAESEQQAPGRDVSLLCTRKDMKVPLRLKVSWQWMKVAEKGLARMIAAAAAAASAPMIVR